MLMLQIVQKSIAPSPHREHVETPQICLKSLILITRQHVPDATNIVVNIGQQHGRRHKSQRQSSFGVIDL